MEKHTILTYKEVLNEIQHKENHLLIANGFNYGLGVNTGYGAIFEKMADNNKKIYNDALKMVQDCDFDLEYFIGKLQDDINQDNIFLQKYVANKIKLDFMQATHEIVKAEIKNIYADKNDGIFVLLKAFTNYFTLNYDSFLYLLLLKYKPIEDKKKNAIAFLPSIKFIEDDLNTNQNSIYSEIKNARDNGKIRLTLGKVNDSLEKDCRMLTKTHFTTEIKSYSKTYEKGWKTKDIDKVVNQIFQEEKSNEFLSKVDDGSKQQTLFDFPELVYDVTSETQNLFFLHGAFHIYKDGEVFKKITQQSDKALYEKLEDVLNNDEQEVVCVFQRSNKTDAINNNNYLKHCFNKLACLSGNLVIIGSSLADNDDHIFEQINSSPIETIYISAFGKMDEVFEAAKSKFPNKEIYLFDAKTISYEKAKEDKREASVTN